MERTINLTESELQRLVMESTRRIMNEMSPDIPPTGKTPKGASTLPAKINGQGQKRPNYPSNPKRKEGQVPGAQLLPVYIKGDGKTTPSKPEGFPKGDRSGKINQANSNKSSMPTRRPQKDAEGRTLYESMYEDGYNTLGGSYGGQTGKLGTDTMNKLVSTAMDKRNSNVPYRGTIFTGNNSNTGAGTQLSSANKQWAKNMLRQIGYNGKGSWIPLAVKQGISDEDINKMRDIFNNKPVGTYKNSYRKTPMTSTAGLTKTAKNMYEAVSRVIRRYTR